MHSCNLVIQKRNPREVVLVLDATFFGKRKDKFGLLIAKDIHSKEAVSFFMTKFQNQLEYQLSKIAYNSYFRCLQAILLGVKTDRIIV